MNLENIMYSKRSLEEFHWITNEKYHLNRWERIKVNGKGRLIGLEFNKFYFIMIKLFVTWFCHSSIKKWCLTLGIWAWSCDLLWLRRCLWMWHGKKLIAASLFSLLLKHSHLWIFYFVAFRKQLQSEEVHSSLLNVGYM